MPNRPFIYISSIMRTGSTLLGEALTQLPHSYIFQEPHIGKNSFRINQNEIRRLQTHNVDVQRFLSSRKLLAFAYRRLRWAGWPQDFMVRQFKQMFATGIFKQVGVKEVRNRGWENYLKHFPDARVLITGRDPRDIYISAFHKMNSSPQIRHDPPVMTPSTMTEMLNKEFALQKNIMAHAKSISIRYEEFCQSDDETARILKFVDSPLNEIGQIGSFIQSHRLRQGEAKKHGPQISSRSIGRYLSEKNKHLLSDAIELFERVDEYCSYWGYQK